MIPRTANFELAPVSRRMAVAMLTAGFAGRTAGVAEESRSGMLLGFSTYGMRTLSTEDAVRHVARIGFDSIELTVWPDWDACPANMSAARRNDVRRRIRESGLVLTSLMEHVTPSASKEVQQKNLTRLEGVFRLAADLGDENGPLVQTVLGGGLWQEKRNLIRDRVGAWLDVARKYGKVLAVKPHRGGVMSTPEEAVWLIRQLKDPTDLRIVYDYSHYAFRGMSLEETVRTALPFLGHVAVKDPVRDGDRVVFQLPGQAGTVPYDRLLRLLGDGKYTGDISCEVSGMVWKQPGYDGVSAAERCYAALSNAFRKSGVARV